MSPALETQHLQSDFLVDFEVRQTPFFSLLLHQLAVFL